MFKIGIDNYGLFPLNISPLQTLQWALDHGAEGVAFSGLDDATRRGFDSTALIQLKNFASENQLYLEWGGGQHIPRDIPTRIPKDIFKSNRIVAEEARALGTRIIRSCSGGLMRWDPSWLPTRQLMDEMAEALLAQKQMLIDHHVILAIETHFEFTTFELLRVFEACGAKPGEWLGICLDTMNLLTMLEDPVMATERVLPWVVSTHMKDGGIQVTDNGFKTFTAPFGQGIVDLDRILAKLVTLPWPVNLSIEDHGGDFDIPIFNAEFRKEFPDLCDEEMEKLIALSEETRKKMEAGTLSVLERKDWAGVCEERIEKDLWNLKIKEGRSKT